MGISTRRSTDSASSWAPPHPLVSASETPSRREAGPEGDRLDPLIGRLYQAAVRPEAWSSFLEELAEVVHADAMTLLAASADGGELREITFGVGTSARAEHDYREYFAALDPWAEAGALSAPVGATSPACVHEADLVRTEFYNDYYAPNGWHHGFGAKLFEDRDGIVASLTGHRDKRAGAFDAEEMQVLTRLVPHLRRALRLRQELESAASEREAVAQLLERVPVGTILVDEQARVVRANRIAEAILEANDGLNAGARGLEAAGPQDTATLRQAIAGAAAATDGSGDEAGGRFRILRPSGARPYLVEVSPIDRESDVWGSRKGLAAILVTDGNGGTQPSCDALRSFYDLTPAEAELTALLVRGLSLDEAATRRQVSRNTARGQLKRVFSKTGTNRQAELVRQVLQGPAGFIKPSGP